MRPRGRGPPAQVPAAPLPPQSWSPGSRGVGGWRGRVPTSLAWRSPPRPGWRLPSGEARTWQQRGSQGGEGPPPPLVASEGTGERVQKESLSERTCGDLSAPPPVHFSCPPFPERGAATFSKRAEWGWGWVGGRVDIYGERMKAAGDGGFDCGVLAYCPLNLTSGLKKKKPVVEKSQVGIRDRGEQPWNWSPSVHPSSAHRTTQFSGRVGQGRERAGGWQGQWQSF